MTDTAQQITAVIDGQPSHVQLETRNDENGRPQEYVAVQLESGGAASIISVKDTDAIDRLIAQAPELGPMLRPGGGGGGDDSGDSAGMTSGDATAGPGSGDTGVTTGQTGSTDTTVDSGAPGGSYADASGDGDGDQS